MEVKYIHHSFSCDSYVVLDVLAQLEIDVGITECREDSLDEGDHHEEAVWVEAVLLLTHRVLLVGRQPVQAEPLQVLDTEVNWSRHIQVNRSSHIQGNWSSHIQGNWSSHI